MATTRFSIRNICIVTAMLLLVYFIGKAAIVLHKYQCHIEITEYKLCQQHHTQFKENLAKELLDIYDEITLMTSKKNPKVLFRFEEILKQVDSGASLHKESDVKRKFSGKEVDVCPERFEGTNAGFPYYEKGWTITKCKNVKPLRSVFTILINTVSYSTNDLNRLKYVLNGIKQTYPSVKVLLAITNKQYLPKHINTKEYDNVKIVKLNSASNLVGKAWNLLSKKASTPYVLIARDIVHFSWLTQIERQIRVVSELPNVGVAGGAYRNTSGHWQMGCFQTTMKNYVLHYQEGYYHSRNECMLCDYLQGPFLAKKSLMKFDESINDEAAFQDLFLTFVKNKILIMGCPDAMYFTKDTLPSFGDKQASRKRWQKLATKWVLNRIAPPHGGTLKFSCSDIGFKCNSEHSRFYLHPVCCQEQYEHALEILQKFTDINNVSFELDAGSILGTVKYDGMMPWDIDGDVRVKSSEIHIFENTDAKTFFKNHGLQLTGYEKPTFQTTTSYDGYVKIRTPDLVIDVWGRPELTCPQFLPKELQHTFTLARVRRTWIKTAFSPGLFVRNRYGVGVLKHSQSWRMAKLEHSYSDYKAGDFLGCENPDHHACLQRFPADGNIPFLVD